MKTCAFVGKVVLVGVLGAAVVAAALSLDVALRVGCARYELAIGCDAL